MKRILFLVCLALPMSANSQDISWIQNHSSVDGFYDPHTWTTRSEIEIGGQIFEPLILNGSGTEYQPVLAENITLIEPGQASITLQSGINFHGGQVFDAEDVAYSLLRAQGEGSSISGLASTITDVSVTDDHTVTVSFTEEYPQLLYVLSKVMMIDSTDEGYFETDYPNIHFNGTGAFRVESYEPGIGLSLTRFEGYRENLIHEIMDVEIMFIENSASAAAAFVGGHAELWTSVPHSAVEQLQRQVGAEVSFTPSDYFYVAELPFAPDVGTVSSLSMEEAQALVARSTAGLEIADSSFRPIEYNASSALDTADAISEPIEVLCQVADGPLGSVCEAMERELSELGVSYQVTTDWSSRQSPDLLLRWRRLQDLVFPETGGGENLQGTSLSLPLAADFRVTVNVEDLTVPLGQTGYPLLSPYADNGKDDGCGGCPPSGACSQAIIQARQKCCPPSGACGQ